MAAVNCNDCSSSDGELQLTFTHDAMFPPSTRSPSGRLRLYPTAAAASHHIMELGRCGGFVRRYIGGRSCVGITMSRKRPSPDTFSQEDPIQAQPFEVAWRVVHVYLLFHRDKHCKRRKAQLKKIGSAYQIKDDSVFVLTSDQARYRAAVHCWPSLTADGEQSCSPYVGQKLIDLISDTFKAKTTIVNKKTFQVYNDEGHKKLKDQAKKARAAANAAPNDQSKQEVATKLAEDVQNTITLNAGACISRDDFLLKYRNYENYLFTSLMSTLFKDLESRLSYDYKDLSIGQTDCDEFKPLFEACNLAFNHNCTSNFETDKDMLRHYKFNDEQVSSKQRSILFKEVYRFGGWSGPKIGVDLNSRPSMCVYNKTCTESNVLILEGTKVLERGWDDSIAKFLRKGLRRLRNPHKKSLLSRWSSPFVDLTAPT